MAIEIGFISVVVRREALEALAPEMREIALGLLRWRMEWFREDAHLLATSFMSPADTRAFGEALERRSGLMRGPDWAVVDMFDGPAFPVAWLETRGGGPSVMGAWRAGTEPGDLSRVPRLTLTGGREVMPLFDRDSVRDRAARSEDFGTTIPAWGGRQLWHVAAGGQAAGASGLEGIAWASLDASIIDFLHASPAELQRQGSGA